MLISGLSHSSAKRSSVARSSAMSPADKTSPRGLSRRLRVPRDVGQSAGVPRRIDASTLQGFRRCSYVKNIVREGESARQMLPRAESGGKSGRMVMACVIPLASARGFWGRRTGSASPRRKPVGCRVGMPYRFPGNHVTCKPGIAQRPGVPGLPSGACCQRDPPGFLRDSCGSARGFVSRRYCCGGRPVWALKARVKWLWS